MTAPGFSIDSAEAFLISLPTRELFAAAHDQAPPEDRELVIVRCTAGPEVGWGECSALNRPSYTDEFARGCFDALTGAGVVKSMARAALLMAVWDLRLKRRGQPLAQWLAPGLSPGARVPAGAALGLGSLDEIEVRAHGLAEDGFERIKLKIAPECHVDGVRAVQRGAPNAEVQVDANGSLDGSHMAALLQLAELGVTAIEQPFAPHDVGAAADLVARGRAHVIADEAVASLEDVQRLWRAGALTGVSIKAARLGGLDAARQMVEWCVREGVAASAGGMLECGLGRHGLAALAAHPGFTITGDVSPARRWLTADPWPDLTMVGGDVRVPAAPGVAPEPNLDLLDRFTLARASVDPAYPRTLWESQPGW